MAAMTDLKNQIASISIGIAEKILERELSAANKQEEYVQELIKNTNLN
jgi:F-type H+-transporting ATPase subunit b